MTLVVSSCLRFQGHHFEGTAVPGTLNYCRVHSTRANNFWVVVS